MQREIKFRGKCPDTGRWIFGLLVHHLREIAIERHYDRLHLYVRPETVGQYTGLKDKNGLEIFEGDIVKLLGQTVREVIFRDGVFGYAATFLDDMIAIGLNFKWRDGRSDVVEVIGNIYDNPELLE